MKRINTPTLDIIIQIKAIEILQEKSDLHKLEREFLALMKFKILAEGIQQLGLENIERMRIHLN